MRPRAASPRPATGQDDARSDAPPDQGVTPLDRVVHRGNRRMPPRTGAEYTERSQLNKRVTRRQIMTGSAAGMALLLLAACGGSATPTSAPAASPATGTGSTASAAPSAAASGAASARPSVAASGTPGATARG